MRLETLERVAGSAQGARIWHFDSVQELGLLGCAARRVHRWDHSWLGESAKDTARKIQQGDDALVSQAQALLDKIEHGGLEVPTTHWEPSVAGAFPVVPSFLAGQPDCMMEMRAASDTRAPVRILVDLTSSGGISAEALHARGVALMALAMLLSAERPVDLRAAVALDNGRGRSANRGMSAAVFRIETAPLEFATACYALTSQGVARGVGYNWLNVNAGAEGAWAWCDNPAHPLYEKLSRAAFGLGPDDIYIGPVHSDYRDWLNPVAWLTAKLAAFRTREGG